MKTETFMVVEVETNTIYMSESSARDMRKPKPTMAGKMFVAFKRQFPNATVKCLSDEEFVRRFHEMGKYAYNEFTSRFTLTPELSARTLMHYQKIA